MVVVAPFDPAPLPSFHRGHARVARVQGRKQAVSKICAHAALVERVVKVAVLVLEVRVLRAVDVFVRGEVDGEQVYVVVEQGEDERHPERRVPHEQSHQPGQSDASVHVERCDLP